MGAAQSGLASQLYAVYVSTRVGTTDPFAPPSAMRIWLPGNMLLTEIASSAPFLAWAAAQSVEAAHVTAVAPAKVTTVGGAPTLALNPTVTTPTPAPTYGNPTAGTTVAQAAAVGGPGTVIAVTLAAPS